MPIISIDATFFWQIINFFLLLFIVKKYFKEPISKIMNKRKEKIETELVTATKNREESEHLLKEAETQINSSRKEASEIIKNAQRKAEEEARNLINIIKATEFEVTKMKNDAKEELSREVKDLAAELAEKIIKEKVDDIQETSLIDKFISEVGEDK